LTAPNAKAPAMVTDVSRVIVMSGTTSSSTRVYHRDFPEIRSDGETAEDAAAHLVNQLVRALDSALTPWRRESIQQAIADVQAFAARSD
jgi:hypothetical protein